MYKYKTPFICSVVTQSQTTFYIYLVSFVCLVFDIVSPTHFHSFFQWLTSLTSQKNLYWQLSIPQAPPFFIVIDISYNLEMFTQTSMNSTSPALFHHDWHLLQHGDVYIYRRLCTLQVPPSFSMIDISYIRKKFILTTIYPTSPSLFHLIGIL